MNKTEFKKLLNYLRCHPTEREELATLLSGEADIVNNATRERNQSLENMQGSQWLTAKQAGAEIGRSSSWIRRRLDLFPSTRRDKNGGYMLLRHELIQNYGNYVQETTTAMGRY